jgi:5-amino-6-(5-phosphoribosylamino)uracil reductase
MNRVHVLLNAAVSADGKLAPSSRRRVRLGSARDLARMDRIRASCDAILIGAGTLRSEDPPLQVRSPALVRARRREGRDRLLTNVVLSRGLDLPYASRFFRDAAVPRIIAAPATAPRRKVLRAGDHGEVLLAGTAGVDPRRLLSLLARRGIRRLVVEGGGQIYGLFLRAGLVDEIHLTVCPMLIGGGTAPTLFDGEGFDGPPFPALRLDLCRREGDEVYLRYTGSR